jgi:hypothetical protein
MDELRRNLAAMAAVDAAEARGDAAAALRVIATARVHDPTGQTFWRPWRTTHLRQILDLGPLLPGWATSRWVQAQALQCLDASGRNRGQRALALAIHVRGGPSTLRGVDEADARCQVIDHDWVFRQVSLYELGGLQHFVTRVASPELLAKADDVRDWARTPMGAFRLLHEQGRTTTWERMGAGEEVDALNLGASNLVAPGECAIGRLVPITDGLMFETAPLPVPEWVARSVASDPRGWIDALRRAVREYRDTDEEVLTSGLHDFGLLTDVPDGLWRFLARVVSQPPRSTGRRDEQLHDRASHDAARLVHGALAGDLGALGGVDNDRAWPEPWSCLAAALVTPGVSDLVLHRLAPIHATGLLQLSRDLTAPGSDICLRLARELQESA